MVDGISFLILGLLAKGLSMVSGGRLSVFFFLPGAGVSCGCHRQEDAHR